MNSGCLLLNHKGQVNSLDLLISIAIFVFLLVFLVMFWFVTTMNIENKIKENRLESTAIYISDTLMKTQGYPTNWEENLSTVHSLGLATYSQNVLDSDKIANFTNLSYSTSKELLGVEYEYYFYIEDLDENRLYESGNSTFGEQIASITRFGILDGEEVKLWVIVHG